jgi:translation initiation factor IF-2
MSVRIHTIAKEIGMDNKELLKLLQDREYDVKTVSSTIDNITADSLREEFKDLGAETKSEPEAEKKETPKPKTLPGSFLPAAAVVKSAVEVEKERQDKLEAEGKAKAPEVKAIGPKPIGPQPVGPQPTIPKPEAKAAPAAPRIPAGAAPKPAPQPSAPAGAAPKPAPTPPPATEKPAPAPQPAGAAPQPGPAPTPPPIAGAAPNPTKIELPDLEPKSTGTGQGQVIELKPPIVVREFALQIGMKPFKLISELMEMGIFGSMNQVLEEAVAQLIAEKHGYTLEIKHRGEKVDPEVAKKKKKEAEKKEIAESMEERPPVVCILGHVDHGKTTLLDTIRKANVVEGEAGGITQHVAAYQVEHKGKLISFIDTPGHAAFSKMRERGANVTDIAILVVAADDGFMPQTEEALRFAQKAQVELIVAINKCDSKGANPDRVRTQMQEKGIQAEDWGGQTIAVNISALKGEGIPELLEMILLSSEMMELRASPKAKVEGVIIESQVEQGRGPTASVIIQSGTLKTGDVLLCGSCYCKVRAIIDESGTEFNQVKNEKAARRAVEEYMEDLKKQASDEAALGEGGGATLESLFEAIESTQRKVLRVIIRADVRGSVEALVTSLEEIKSDKVDLEIVNTGVGQINKSDVEVAQTANAIILGFSVGMENGIRGLAKHHGVDIYQNNIIYEMIDLVKDSMTDLLEPELKEKKVGGAEIRQIFPIGKSLTVAGCMITDGRILRDRKARLVRKGKILIESRVETLKRFKDDVNEVKAGYECGIRLAGYNDYEEGDLIECIEVEKIRPKL